MGLTDLFKTIRKAIAHERSISLLVRKVIWVIREEGFDGILFRVKFLRRRLVTLPPNQVYLYRSPSKTPEVLELVRSFSFCPKISVVMPVYNVEKKWLKLAFDSLLGQWYENWELCICDDASTNIETIEFLRVMNEHPNVKLTRNSENKNISKSSNEALLLADGEYLALMDHDDELTEDAFFEVVRALQSTQYDFLYSDEDKIELNGDYTDPHFKPDYAPDFFHSTNYISHLSVIRRDIVEQVGGWSTGLEGAQDYDLYLRVFENTSLIHHIPKVLYHWRKIPGSTAAEFGDKSFANEAGRLAVELAIARRGIDARVNYGHSPGTYRVKYQIVGAPLVSIIIPFKNRSELLSKCLNSILDNTSYENLEVIGVDNASDQSDIVHLKSYFSRLDSRIRFYDYNGEFNFSDINNTAVTKYALGEYIVFMNNDIEVLTRDWVESLLEHAQRQEVGAVGARLMYPNHTIQHAGIVMAPDAANATINVFQNQLESSLGYLSRHESVGNYSAVTAALMMIKKDSFLTIGGFDAENLKVAYNDVDLCLRLRAAGKLVVYTPFVRAFHHESASRGFEDNLIKLDRSRRELHIMKEKNHGFYDADPYFNKNLAQNRDDFSFSAIVTRDFEKVIPKTFHEEVIFEAEFSPISARAVCVFAHYDAGGLIAPYVIYYLTEIKKHMDIVFVSTSEKMSKSELYKIQTLVNIGIIKKNIGYDFGSWKTAIDRIDHDRVDRLVMCNDSVFGPLFDLGHFFVAWEESGANAFGITDSFEIRHHLQSYFVGFDKKTINSASFVGFWAKMKVIELKEELILRNEIGLSEELRKAGLVLDCLAPARKLGYLNNTHLCWKELITEFRSPFVKLELLRDNPLERDLSTFQNVVEHHSDYPCDLIDQQLLRAGIQLDSYLSSGHVEQIKYA